MNCANTGEYPVSTSRKKNTHRLKKNISFGGQKVYKYLPKKAYTKILKVLYLKEILRIRLNKQRVYKRLINS